MSGADVLNEGGRPAIDPQWRLRYLTLAPHRLGFVLAVLLLVVASLWWALVQVDRATGALGLPMGTPAFLTHAALMSFGFIPLFFAGFLFTAGPRWLNVEPLPVSRIRTPLLLQAAGWLVWLLGGLFGQGLGLVGLAIAWLGLSWMGWLYAGLVRASRAPDQAHGKTARAAFLVGSISVAALGISLALGRYDLARAWTLTGLWGFVAVVFMVVAHRMIPFFTHGVIKGVEAWRPYWVLALLVVAVAVQAVFVWLEMVPWPAEVAVAGLWVRGAAEFVVGLAVLWLVLRWGLVPSLKVPLLAMLHIGFMWLGLAYLISGATQWWSATSGTPVWHLAALHAFTMGCLGSLILAMVTRVSCGHSGRPLVAGALVWSLFLLLQATVVVRVVAALPLGVSNGLLALAALLWALIVLLWGLRMGGWYGRLRIDGNPG